MHCRFLWYSTLIFKTCQKNTLEKRILTQKEKQDRAHVLTSLIKQLKIDSKNMDDVQARFRRIDSHRSGLVTYSQFCEGLDEPEFNPICRSLFDLFDTDEENQVDYREFLIGLANILAQNKEQRLKLIFFVQIGNTNAPTCWCRYKIIDMHSMYLISMKME